MKSINNDAVINYTLPQNILATSVSWVYAEGGSGDTAGEFTVTDNTVYPDGDSRATVNVTLADKFGHIKQYNIGDGDASNSIAIDAGGDGFNDSLGLAAMVTVASTLRHYKDGSAFGIGYGKNSGNFMMEI